MTKYFFSVKLNSVIVEEVVEYTNEDVNKYIQNTGTKPHQITRILFDVWLEKQIKYKFVFDPETMSLVIKWTLGKAFKNQCYKGDFQELSSIKKHHGEEATIDLMLKDAMVDVFTVEYRELN